MPTYRDEFDVLLPAVDMIEGELAKDVLEQAGIPSMLLGRAGPDFDQPELGFATLDMPRSADVLLTE